MKTWKHNRSNSKLLTCKMGSLIPVQWHMTMPGDRFQGSTQALIRVAPLLAPIMSSARVRFHHWFVPLRLIWDDFEKWITGGPDGLDATVFPTFTVSESLGESTLADYLGIPPTFISGTISALPFRACALIWNEYYRDKDLQTALTVSKASGTDATTSKALQQCAWGRDYFTIARPWEQRGTAMTIPMAESAPVVGPAAETAFQVRGITSNVTNTVKVEAGTDWNLTLGDPTGFTDGETLEFGTTTGLEANLADVAGTIEELRYAAALQRFEEARGRWGGSYPEYLLAMGIRYSDARLQRPQYIGGGHGPLQFSEVLQTAPDVDTGTSEDEGVGNIKGHGIGSVRSNRFRRFFEEHGIFLTFMSVRPQAFYESGLDREWLKRTKEEFYMKELANLGQQAITRREVQADHATATSVFGYVDRYDEYRRTYNTIHGEFRGTLDFWHQGRIFTDDPTLNSAFVSCVPTTRNYAATWEDQLWCRIDNRLKTRRPVIPIPNPKLM